MLCVSSAAWLTPGQSSTCTAGLALLFIDVQPAEPTGQTSVCKSMPAVPGGHFQRAGNQPKLPEERAPGSKLA